MSHIYDFGSSRCKVFIREKNARDLHAVDNSVDSAKQSVVRRLEYGFLMLATFNDNRLPPRFWAKVKVDDVSGCWKWTGGRNCRLCENLRNRTAYHRRRNHVSQP